MTATDILTDAMGAVSLDLTEADKIEILRIAIAHALPQFKSEVLDAFHQGETSGFASASVVADRVLG